MLKNSERILLVSEIFEEHRNNNMIKDRTYKTHKRVLYNTKKYSQKEYQSKQMKNICLQIYFFVNTLLKNKSYTV